MADQEADGVRFADAKQARTRGRPARDGLEGSRNCPVPGRSASARCLTASAAAHRRGVRGRQTERRADVDRHQRRRRGRVPSPRRRSRRSSVTRASVTARGRRVPGALSGGDRRGGRPRAERKRPRSRAAPRSISGRWTARRLRRRRVFTYFWTHALPGPDAARYGAFHTSEVPYVLNTLSCRTVRSRRRTAKSPIGCRPTGPTSPRAATPTARACRSGPPSADAAMTMEVGDHSVPYPSPHQRARRVFPPSPDYTLGPLDPW